MRREELGGCGGCEGSATRKPQVFIKSQTEVMAKKTKMGEMVVVVVVVGVGAQ